MITNIGLLVEELSVLIYIHYLYDKKFEFDIKTTSYLTVYMIIMAAINYYKVSQAFTMITYPLILFYCGIKFGFRIKELIINNILYMVIVGGIQLIIITCYGWIFNTLSFDMLAFRNKEMLIANGSVLLVVLFMLPKIKLNRLSIYLQNREWILTIFLCICIVLVVAGYVNYKVFSGLEIYQYLFFFISIVLFCILTGQLGKYKIRSKEIETELKMHKLYADSFHGLIEEIRLRQHEFDNHISTIYSLHYTHHSYEALVKAQNEYSQTLIKENRYNKLLKAGNPMLIGFLYGKLVEAEKHDINVTYQIDIGELNVDVPIYKLIEILGNLIKNAVEAMETQEECKALYIRVVENGIGFAMEVRNKSEFVDYSQIEAFFKKGFSKKGKNRGLGLYNIKNICNNYSLDIFCENKIIEGENWLSFEIRKNEAT